jgi:DNA-directed RNA polymerase specialized sigma24 family protein
MSDEGSITALLHEFRDGDSLAAQRLWNHYYQRLVRLARRKLGDVARRVSDEDDVVLHAFNSFCVGAAAGRFPQLEDRDDLWQILVMLTARKAGDQRREQMRLKRGGGSTLGESALYSPDRENAPSGLDGLASGEPTPEFAAQVTEEYRRLLVELNDDTLKSIAVARMEGYSVADIADRLQVNPRTVERKLRLIREIWSAAEGSANSQEIEESE